MEDCCKDTVNNKILKTKKLKRGNGNKNSSSEIENGDTTRKKSLKRNTSTGNSDNETKCRS